MLQILGQPAISAIVSESVGDLMHLKRTQSQKWGIVVWYRKALCFRLPGHCVSDSKGVVFQTLRALCFRL